MDWMGGKRRLHPAFRSWNMLVQFWAKLFF